MTKYKKDHKRPPVKCLFCGKWCYKKFCCPSHKTQYYVEKRKILKLGDLRQVNDNPIADEYY